MITLKLKHYNTDDLYTLMHVLDKGQQEIRTTCERENKRCTMCNIKHVCQDVQFALEFVEHEISNDI